MRRITLEVGSTPIGTALTWAYPHGQSHGFFTIPTYELVVSGTDDEHQPVSRSFEVFRFGVKCDRGEEPHVVGFAEEQAHAIKAWIPNFAVHRAAFSETGAWRIHDHFLIHDGPDDPQHEAYAAVGHIEVCGPRGFDKFNDFVIQLSGSTTELREDKLKQIGSSGAMVIRCKQTERPELVPGRPSNKLSNQARPSL
jgi:hypothetical protein